MQKEFDRARYLLSEAIAVFGRGGAQAAQRADYQQYMKQYADLYKEARLRATSSTRSCTRVLADNG